MIMCVLSDSCVARPSDLHNCIVFRIIHLDGLLHKIDTVYHSLYCLPEALPDQHLEMISIGPDVSLYEAIRVLIHNRIHRLPVIDPYTGNVLYILTHKRILRFLFLYVSINYC